ncbi:MAG: hypothetical protein HHJ16_12540 [Polaromonas sp.]|uniref:lycopene cyclase family protein n=1 Tax=Polaromonas sp. TaxID=1869339 RepID=UPI0017924FE8|nr:lycopene cyclase family protein [Polaromonas sp.]NMM11082.1 hypothetical protein [Polaromonas sp.]
MRRDVELLILGGGCAGLSLAMRLAQLGHRAPATLILEQRPRYLNDRTWCFWGGEATPFAQLAQHQWPVVKVRNADQTVRIDCASTPYRMLAAEQFQAVAQAALMDAPQLHLQMDTPVLSEPQFHGGRWHLDTAVGQLTAAMVVDTRPLQMPALGGALLWQSFYGYEIDCSQTVFEPGCADLMDFLPANPERVAFTYVLPISKTRALVEFTVFAVAPLAADDLAAELNAAIAQRVNGAHFTVLRTEHGVLPMGLDRSASGWAEFKPAYVRVGVSAGAARPATGYAFQRIQRWAAGCAQAIAGGGWPIGHVKDPALLWQMDRLFLNLIRRQPELAPQLFMTLFVRADSQKVIRFLSDCGSLLDYTSIILALPVKPFLQQLFSAASSGQSLPAGS